MVLSLTVAGFLEGVGIMALLPLITILTEQAQAQGGFLAEAAQSMFNALGVKPTIASALFFIVAAMFLKAVVSMLASIQIAYASSHVSADLRLNFIHSLFSARWSHYVGLKSGATANAIGTEAQRASICFKQGCQAFSHTIQILVYAILAFLISWKLAIAALGVGLLMVAILGFLTREARRSGRKLTDVYNDVLSLITDSFYGAKPLKAMGKGTNLYQVLEKHVRDLQSAQRRLDIADQSLIVLSEPLMVMFVAIGLYGALTFNALPLSELLFMAVLFLRMIMRVSSAQRSYQSMVSNESAMQSLQSKESAAIKAKENFSCTKTPTLDKNITLDNVSFAYGDTPIIENISLKIPVNTLQVIFGPSGTGKTTLVDLIIGLYQPTGGGVQIDGTPLSEVDLRLWRQMVGYVPQDVLLFHDSVLNNVTLNDPKFKREDVELTLKKADAWDFVKNMEQGLDTVVGERGSRLSGGQRQRIAIARAIIHKPSVLVLDEATSALDPDTEQQILKTVKELSKTMTVLAISHNPAILGVADNVYEIKNESQKSLIRQGA
ncbi:MAG: ABC transporter ATP-binding protein [Micavibrio sp.]|nr:MAG: ABC transporter ATP-binding protein [Micavibrio sp.]